MPDHHGEVLAALAAELSEGALVSDPGIVDGYRFDRAMTVAPGRPLCLVRAADRADVATTMRIVSRFGVPVVPRGAGTGLSGGAAAVDGAITLSTERMRDLTIDPAAMVAVVEPGALNVEVKVAARADGLWYPPDPSSFEISSIGGNVATNAGGLCCVKYGVTGDYVLGLEVVLADGRCVRLGGRTVKDVAGYDLKRLFVGSEGTLGIITEATLRLRPAPSPLATVVATFDDVADAGRAIVAVMGRVRPTTLELMDRAAVAAVEAVAPMGLEAVGTLLLGQSDAGSGDVEVMAEAFEAAGATYLVTTEDPDEGGLLMGARRMAVPCVERLGTVLIEDVCVPIPRIPELVTAVEALAGRHRTMVPVIGHAGDGNFHPLVTFDAADPAAAARADRVFDGIMEVALELGGTVTGEHGVGTLKARQLADQLGDDVLDLNRRVKAALDPQGLLNPGKWV